jgi:predicted nucleic acid-binding protein
MARKILLDANVIDQINRGNEEAAKKLIQLRKEGHHIWVARQTYEELVVKPFIPRTRVANEQILAELRIPVAPSGKMSDRAGAYDRNPPKAGLSEGKDVMIAGQAVAIDAEVWSFDKAFRNNHAQLKKEMGLRVAPESYTIPLENGVADYRVGRKLLGLPPIRISLKGAITTIGPWRPSNVFMGSVQPRTKPGGGGSGGGGTKAHTGTPLAPVVVGGPSEMGGKVVHGSRIYLQGVELILNLVTDAINEQRCEKALAERQVEIEKYARKHPDQGTLIVLYFQRLVPAPESIVVPKPLFDHVRVYHGRNLAMAKEAWQTAPDISASALAERVWETDLIWIKPLAPRPIRAKELRLPFPEVALARFAAGKIRFRDVEFGG